MTPVAFDGCFGFLHAARGDTAVVLCGAFGFEQLCAHRGWRELAERFAAEGSPTLRFDWSGCGDSLGRDSDPARIATWQRNLRSALVFLHAHVAPRRIVLVGLRFGAALAASVAAEREDIDGLIAFAPAISGRTYGRELAALSRMMTPDSPEVSALGVSVAGFLATHETLEAMKTLDLRRLDARPARQALILAHDAPASVEAQQRWSKLGCETSIASFDESAAWLADPTLSQPPAAAFEAALAWMRARFPAHEGAPPVAGISSPSRG